MRIRWDWLHPVLTAPYVPTLGPAHPQAIAPQLFADAVEITGTGRFLSYDKDRRWAASKDKHVLAGAIVQQPGLVLVPTFSSRSRAVKVHVYSNRPHAALNRAAGLAGRLCASHQAERSRLVWFLPPGSTPGPGVACTRIQMRTFSSGHHDAAAEPGPGLVVPLGEVPDLVRATFSAFAEKLAAEGFSFLDARIRHGGVGPVLTCVRDGQVVGAIGPMEIMPDSRGISRLLPQYFGILPDYRGLGFGRALWRAAMHWGQQHQAAYQLLQTEVNGASDRLCQSEGLTDLGLVCTSTV
jgi:GNAT superfamily N-acetyltransferase